jgi:hypothetical protein
VDNFVECPKCGFTQPDGEECIACGIIFAKYWALQQPSGELSAPAEPSVHEAAGELTAPEPSVIGGEVAYGVTASAPPAESFAPAPIASPEEVESYQLEQEPVVPPAQPEPIAGLSQAPLTGDPMQVGQLQRGPDAAPPKLAGQPEPGARPVSGAGRPGGRARHRVLRHDMRASETIGTSTMVIRSLAGLACLGIAVLMFANGKGLLSVWPYVIMVFYAGAALWGLSSFRQKITLQQFATEMALLVLVTLGMRLAAPEMFTVESRTQGAPKVVQPYLPQTALGSFAKRVLVYVEAGRSVMASREVVSKGTWDTWTKQTEFASVKGMYSMLNTEDRARVWDVWKRVEELGPMLADMQSRYQAPEADGVRFKAPENERATVRRELDDALLKAGQLRARLLVYPEISSDY